jgi:hypothetical protein
MACSLHGTLLNSKGRAQETDQLTTVVFLTIESNADVKQCSGFDPIRHAVMQSLRETEITLHCTSAASQPVT